nr:MAG TPA: hypothetical protein [Caudoviricetes sp.]
MNEVDIMNLTELLEKQIEKRIELEKLIAKAIRKLEKYDGKEAEKLRKKYKKIKK